jgi:hypothetical protein
LRFSLSFIGKYAGPKGPRTFFFGLELPGEGGNVRKRGFALN